jgi:lysozyme family protein
MKHSFAPSLKRVLVHEGGKVDDPRDPGGRTNQGVTQKTFTGWLKAKGRKSRDVYTMTAAERDAIYRLQYWDAIKGDRLPDGLDYAVFDGAVNSGSSQAVKWLQRALNVTADGALGQITLAAIDAHPNHDELISDMLDRRLAFLRSLKTWPTYKKGWTSRVESVRRAAQDMASGQAPTGKPTFFAGGNQKARLEDAKPIPKPTAGDGAVGGGAGIAGTLTWAQSQLEPLADASPYIAQTITGIVVAGVAVAVGGIGYSWWTRKRASALRDALDLKAVQAPAPEVVV